MGGGRVLLVDDSVVVRRLVANALTSDESVGSVITAPNGKIALEKLGQFNPDLVILDVEMPELDGIATLKEMRLRAPDVPVLMFSALTERAGALTLDALSFGARDYVTKPSTVQGSPVSLERCREELLAKTRALLKLRTSTPPSLRSESFSTPAPQRPRGQTPIELVAIGASTGGPNALAEVLSGLPSDFGVPIVIVQHMPPLFTKLFSERLDAQLPFRVREAVNGASLATGDVWIAPGDFHMVVRRSSGRLTLQTQQEAPENSCRPAVDVLFRSVAEAVGPAALGVVLTGMGVDGMLGATRMREAGGSVIVQDRASSVVWSMPGSVAGAGQADEVVALEHVSVALCRRVAASRQAEASR